MNILFLGGFGTKTLIYFIKYKLISPNHQYYLLNTDKQALIDVDNTKNKFPNINTILIFENYCHGPGSGGNGDMIKEIALQNQEYLLSFLDKNNPNIFIAGLAGGTGNGLCRAYSDIIKKHNYNARFIVTTPLEFEGKEKKQIAHNSIAEMDKKRILIIENEKLYHIMDKKTSMAEAFDFVSEFIHYIIKKIENHSNVAINELNDEDRKYSNLVPFEDINFFINNNK
jgi:cell division GTPase FtsZ